MSGLKSAWEIGLEKSNEINPELKSQRKLTAKQKKEIAGIRKEYEARFADKEVMFEHKLNKLVDRVPPENLHSESDKLREEFAGDKRKLEEEMDYKINAIRSL